jgi:type IV pilus assembly protein PilY1
MTTTTRTASQRDYACYMLALTVAAAGLPAPVQAAEIPDIPLQASIATEPNVTMILDDSGSMHFEIMPDDYTPGGTYYVFPRADNVYGPSDYTNNVATINDAQAYAALARSPQVNTIYYNPGITYTPWSRADGSLFPNAPPGCAPHNPVNAGAGCRNLVTNMARNGATWRACTSAGNCPGTTNTPNFWTATYYWHNGGDIWTRANYTQRQIRNTTPNYNGEGRANRSDCNAGTCTFAQEIQNFANWYTYYRSRVLTARAGIGKAFSAQDSGLRVGFAAINKASTNVDGSNHSTLISGVRKFEGDNRSNFFGNLYNHQIPAAGTPLRRALDDIGRYYSRTDNRGPWSSTPGDAGGTTLACRQSYAILMTDGYWSEGAEFEATGAARNDNDSVDGSLINGPNGQSLRFRGISPFRDGRNNTLADVAAHYWKTDLHPTLTNAVPTSVSNPAFWQHMVTFGVGLGVSGTVNPTTAFNAIDTTPPPTITWPDPVGNNPAKLDDLLHAAVNSRGAFFSAQNPTQFANALTGMLNEISERKSSSASVSINSSRVSASSLVFSSSYNTRGWSGELEAYGVTSSGVGATAKWKASEEIPSPHTDRKIWTMSGGNKGSFQWSNLSSDDQTAIGSANVLNYLRGDRSQEKLTKNDPNGTYRHRTNLLGDIVHSSPVFDKDTNTVFVGANDGMLHAFYAETGVERFAYVPSAMLQKIGQLSDPAYTHKFFVDGEMDIGRKSDTFLEKTYLVATLGRGGKGLFALDVTKPSSFGADNIAWEYFKTDDNDLGHMLGKPIVARMNNGSAVAIVGNGYNSASGRAVLYLFDLKNGTILKKFDTAVSGDNGLAGPGVFDQDGDGRIDYIYAGDLKGNVWKFDVSAKESSAWTHSKLFTALDASNNPQPITAPINAFVNYVHDDKHHAGKRFVFFGTGAYFREGDPNSKATQTWYGLIDEGSAIAGRGSLWQGGITSTFNADGLPARAFKEAVKEDNKFVLEANKRGWYIDLTDPSSGAKGERMTTGSVLLRMTEPTLIASSIIPVADDPCQPGGSGYVNVINAFTGGRLTTSPFVLTNGGNNANVGSLDFGIGMPSAASVMISGAEKGKLIVGGTGSPTGKLVASGTGTEINTGAAPSGRISWRETTGQ